jgi:hypothetical protein
MSMMFEQDDENEIVPVIRLAYRPETPEELGRLQMTRNWERALVAPEDTSAALLATLVAMNNMDLVITIDPSDRVSGVLTAEDLARFGQLVRGSIFAGLPPMLDGVPVLDDDNFTIRGRRPQLYWCEAGKHDTTDNPCKQHPPK